MKDYKLSEVKAICESAKDCGGCPLRYDEKHCILEVNMKKWNFDVVAADNEIRKETIKEIARYIDDEKGFCGLGLMMAKHFGVEVE